MNNDNLKTFKTKNSNEEISFNSNDYGKFGFIVSEKYDDKLIYLPADPNNKELHHGLVLKFALGKLFHDEKVENYEKYKQINSMNKDCYMDSDEVAISSFITSHNSIVFLNTSDEPFKSGLLFLPDDIENLDSEKKDTAIKALDYLYEGNDQTSQIIMVPPIDKTLDEYASIEVLSLDEYKEKNPEIKK